MMISNPVLAGFHPDPSILRVGETYYLATSTFEWYPGVEIYQSKDLAEWKHVTSPLSEKRLLDMTGCASSCGIWAPCLSYDDGIFYLIYTNTQSWNAGPWKDAPNFLTTAKSIEGPWSDPVFLNCSGFDPSMFHDDGKHYIVNMEWDYREIDKDQFTGILLQEYSLAEKRLVGETLKIFTGTAFQRVEGPHLYKKNGYYYLLTAEGGTSYEHAATVARSKNLEGPYEVHPSNPLVTSYNWPDYPVQRAGHASWCDTPDGSRWYLAYLCGRPFPGTQNCTLGRETGIAEIEWREDWPYIKYADGTLGNNELYGTSVPNWPPLAFDGPVNGKALAAPKPQHYTFDGNSIDPAFKTLRMQRDPEIYSLTARPGYLRLRGGQSPTSRYQQTLLARRQQDFSFDAETYVEFEPKSFQELAGLSWRYDEDIQYFLAVSYDEKKGKVIAVHTMDIMAPGKYSRTDNTPIGNAKGIWLGLSVRGRNGFFRYSLDGKIWNTLRPILDAAKLSDEYFHEGFTGAFVGMFCVDTARYAAIADFSYFNYTPKENSAK
jgi:xylan 1,4-beta-xylosidase